MKSVFIKNKPVTINYRDYRKFDTSIFRTQLSERLSGINEFNIEYDNFENIFMELLNVHVPKRKRITRANNAPFMNKILSKAVMNQSRLRNKYLKNPTLANKRIYKRYRIFCVNLFKKEKRQYYDPNLITDNKTWKTVKPLFSDKHSSNRNIILIEDEKIISEDNEVAEKMNGFFAKAVENLI